VEEKPLAEANDHRKPAGWLVYLLPLLVVLVALGARLAFGAAVFRDGLLPIGPDVDDWLLGVSAFVDGQPDLLQPHRYPLVPALASVLVRGLSVTPAQALWSLSLGAGALASGVCWGIAHRYLTPLQAVGPALCIALAPAMLASSNQAFAYGPAALAFLVLAWSLLWDPRGWGPFLAALAAAGLVASLQQGLLELLFMLPVALFLRRWRVLLGAILGAVLGLGLVYWLHPDAFDPIRWMLAELWRYLSGNVAEETQALRCSYSSAWARWVTATFQLRAPPALACAVLMLLGLGMGRAPRAARIGLAWLAAPAAVLVALLGSSHHLIHLIPLVVIAVFLGASRLFPVRWGAVGVLVTFVMLGFEARRQFGEVLNGALGQGGEVADQMLLGEAVEASLPSGGLMLYLDPPVRERFDVIRTARWSISSDIEIVHVVPGDPSHAIRSLGHARSAGRPVLVVAHPGSPPPWRVGTMDLDATNPSRHVTLRSAQTERELWQVVFQEPRDAAHDGDEIGRKAGAPDQAGP
jgi:hypothetical protein